jgi:hypothetical protein
MKKKILFLLFGVIALPLVLWASTIVYSGYLANETTGYAKNSDLDLKFDGQNGRAIDSVAATAVISSGTLAAASWNDGRLSTGSFTVSSLTNIGGEAASDTITVSSSGANLKNYYLIVNGKRLRHGYDWGSPNGTSLTTTALAAADIATVCNKLTLVSASTTAATVVTLTARTKGTAGNALTLVKYGSGLAVGGAKFTGGLDPAVIIINGVSIPTISTDTVAHEVAYLVAQINANATLSPLITASDASPLVNLTAKTVGVNAYTTTSNFSGITAASAAMSGGEASAYTLNSPTIHSLAHGLTTSVPVLYTSTFTLGGLTTGTTYYTIALDANNFQLATTSTDAAAGNYITLTSSSTAGPHTFTVTPTATTGSWGAYWMTSDDDTDWTEMPVTVSSITFATPFTTSTTTWDLGTINHRYLRFHVAAGSGGSIKAQVAVTGRNSN